MLMCTFLVGLSLWRHPDVCRSCWITEHSLSSLYFRAHGWWLGLIPTDAWMSSAWAFASNWLHVAFRRGCTMGPLHLNVALVCSVRSSFGVSCSFWLHSSIWRVFLTVLQVLYCHLTHVFAVRVCVFLLFSFACCSCELTTCSSWSRWLSWAVYYAAGGDCSACLVPPVSLLWCCLSTSWCLVFHRPSLPVLVTIELLSSFVTVAVASATSGAGLFFTRCWDPHIAAFVRLNAFYLLPLSPLLFSDSLVFSAFSTLFQVLGANFKAFGFSFTVFLSSLGFPWPQLYGLRSLSSCFCCSCWRFLRRPMGTCFMCGPLAGFFRCRQASVRYPSSFRALLFGVARVCFYVKSSRTLLPPSPYCRHFTFPSFLGLQPAACWCVLAVVHGLYLLRRWRSDVPVPRRLLPLILLLPTFDTASVTSSAWSAFSWCPAPLLRCCPLLPPFGFNNFVSSSYFSPRLLRFGVLSLHSSCGFFLGSHDVPSLNRHQLLASCCRGGRPCWVLPPCFRALGLFLAPLFFPPLWLASWQFAFILVSLLLSRGCSLLGLHQLFFWVFWFPLDELSPSHRSAWPLALSGCGASVHSHIFFSPPFSPARFRLCCALTDLFGVYSFRTFSPRLLVALTFLGCVMLF